MSQPNLRSTVDHDREHRHVMRWGFIASVLVHVLAVLLFTRMIAVPLSPFAAAGERTGDDRAAAGGGMEFVTLRATEAIEQPVEVVPIIVVEPELVVEPVVIEPPQPEPISSAAAADTDAASDAGEGRGAERGPGTETGTGTGDGGTTDEGLFRVVAPSPRGLILPPSDRPGRVRGREVGVWVFVSAQGTVVPDSTRLQPGSGDNRFDGRLREQAAQWRFEPARRGGAPVAEWFRYIIIL